MLEESRKNRMREWVDIYEAIEQSISKAKENGKGKEEIAAELWPHMDIGRAIQRLNDCSNSNRRERFTPEELLKFQKVTDSYLVLFFICDYLGFGRPDKKAEVKAEEVRRQERERIRELTKLCTMAGRLDLLDEYIDKNYDTQEATQFLFVEMSKEKKLKVV